MATDILAALEAPLDNEEALLDHMLLALTRGELPPGSWEALTAAALRDDRVSELAFAFELVMQGKRLKSVSSQTGAEFLVHASAFFLEALGDDFGAISYLERAIALSPGYPPAFQALDRALTQAGEHKKLADLCFSTVTHRHDVGEKIALLRRAAALYEPLSAQDDRGVDVLQMLLKLVPDDVDARIALEGRYIKQNRHRDVAKLLEGALTTTPEPTEEEASTIRQRLIDLYSNQLQEPERALPHAELVLAADPFHEEARRVAERLLVNKANAGRAAAALSRAAFATGDVVEMERFLVIELEHTRGAKRFGVLKRLGTLRQDALQQSAAAFEAFDAALAIDPTDDDLRARYVELAVGLGTALDAARSLTRVATAAKELAVRSRIAAEAGVLLRVGGDLRRARATFVSILSMPEADPTAIVRAAHELVDVYTTEGDTRALTDVLDKVGELEPDPELRRSANEQLAELAASRGDDARAIVAYTRLTEGPSRAHALAQLEVLHERCQNVAELAQVLLEREKETSSRAEARQLAFRAAEILTQQGGDVAKAAAAWRGIAERYGATRNVHLAWIPLLEAQRDWASLAEVLAADADIAPEAERAAILARLGHVHLTRLADEVEAFEIFSRVLEFDPQEPTTRGTLEKLLSNKPLRARAAEVLEPVYRAERNTAGLLRVLEVRVEEADGLPARLAALLEASRVAEETVPERAVELAALGLRDAAHGKDQVLPWLERAERLSLGLDAKRRSALFSAALGELEVDSPGLLALARRAGDALSLAGDVASALGVYRRALAFDPSSEDLMSRVDELLKEQGNAEERVALYRSALEQDPERERRRQLLHGIGSIERYELLNPQAAIEAYQRALADDQHDREAFAALAALFAETERYAELCDVLERSLETVSQEESRRLRAQLADVAAAHGQPDRARHHLAVLLADAALAGVELTVVERVATTLKDADLAEAVLERRLRETPDVREHVDLLERLGTLALEGKDDPDRAKERFRAAADLALALGEQDVGARLYETLLRVAPFDVGAATELVSLAEERGAFDRLPALLDILLASEDEPRARVALMLKKIKVLSQSLGDDRGALATAAAAFDVAPEDRAVLTMFGDLAARTGDTDLFCEALDAKLTANADGRDKALHADLVLAKARLLGRDPDRYEEAALAYRSVLRGNVLDHARTTSALTELEELALSDSAPLTLADGSTDGGNSRHNDLRWVWNFRVERADDSERATLLSRWAEAEERVLGDAERALLLYRRVVELDPEQTDALDGVARLSLAAGDVEGTVAALLARRDRSNGEARNLLDLDIAEILVSRTTRLSEALASVAAVLESTPHDPRALALGSRLLRAPAVRTRAVETFDRALELADDLDAKVAILSDLIASAEEAGETPDALFRWYEEVVDLQTSRGHRSEALEAVLHAAARVPTSAALWDRAESLCRDLETPSPVAELYETALDGSLSREDAVELGKRAVSFFEEWFDDSNRSARVLERILETDPNEPWAFDRLKLLFDAEERWTDLFGLFDRAIVAAPPDTRVELLEEAAQVAKDFASDPVKAIDYLEQLRGLTPSVARVDAALERLYERTGRFRELIALYTSQIPNLPEREGQDVRARIAQIWVDELKDVAAALAIVEDLVAREPELGPRKDVEAILERILASTSAGADAGRDDTKSTRPSGKRAQARQRAAAILKERYAATQQEGDLVRILEVELEAVKGAKERARRHEQIAVLHETLGDPRDALDHVVQLVLLEPTVKGHRDHLEQLASRVNDFPRLVEVLVEVAERCDDEALRVELTLHAGLVVTERLQDPDQAIELFTRVLASPQASDEVQLAACRAAEPLLAAAHRTLEHLDVLERQAALEPEPEVRYAVFAKAARLATDAQELERATWAWEACLELAPSDAAALDGLVALFDRTGQSKELAAVLGLRCRLPTRSTAARRADYVRIANLLGETLGEVEEAIRAWDAEEQEFGESDENIRARLSLYRASRQWEKLAALLERAAHRPAAPEVQASFLCELGDVAREYLETGPTAIASYESALQKDPRSEGARAGLRALLRRPEVRAEAVRVLLFAFGATDEWRSTLELTEHRIATAKDGPARIAVFHEAAQLSERRGDDREAAFSLIRRAFLLDPGRADTATELFRLAELTRQWRSVADAQREAIEAKESIEAEPPWLPGLRTRMGEVLETRLDDPRAALVAFARVAADDPGNLEAARATIRNAGRVMRWDAAARALVESAFAVGALPPELLAAFEDAAAGATAWDAATFALAAVVSDRGDPSDLARALETQLARWHRDRRGDPDSAEAAFLRALAHGRDVPELLAELAQLQRRSRGRPLIDSLLRLSHTTGGDLDLLREAADTARDHVADRALAKSILARLVKLATDRWVGEDADTAVSSGMPAEPAGYIRQGVRELVDIHKAEGDLERVTELLLETSLLPFPRGESRALRFEAAGLFAGELEASARAITLYERLFEEDPSDEQAVRALSGILTREGRQRDLLTLARRRVEVCENRSVRLMLRIETARIEAQLGDSGQAMATLRQNLEEAPRHGETVTELVTLLERERSFADLAALYASQAERAEADVERAEAAEWFERAAEVAAARLAQPALAAQHYRRVVALEPRPTALAALATLATDAAEHGDAAEYLERLRHVSRGKERVDVVLRMVSALIKADRLVLAIERLEEEVARTPEAEPLRARLLATYRERDDFASLARTLTAGAQYAPDKATRLSRLREAAELYCTEVREPERAIPLLEMARDLAPEERAVRLALSDALGLSGRIDEARVMLRAIIDDFAGRRPKERAPVHYHLARLDLVVGDRPRALVELDAATRIDPANPEILRTLAELSRDDGQLDRAERSYRALLTVLRRHDALQGAAGISRSEVLVELAEIAQRQEQHDRAAELFESALEVAADSDAEGRRLERSLRERENFHGLVRALTQRLAKNRAEARDDRDFDGTVELARVLDEHLQSPEAALDAWLEAIAIRPGSQLAHEQSLELATRLGLVSRYAEELRELARVTEKPASMAAELHHRLGRVYETGVRDERAAVAAYERAHELDPSSHGTLEALDRMYEALGDEAGQARTLAARIALGKESSDALYRLAQLQFKSKVTVDDACDALEDALESEPLLDRAEPILRHAAEAHPGEERVLALYERVGRQGYPRALVDALTRRWAAGLAEAYVLREAVETARGLPDADLAEFWLRRFLERDGHTTEDRLWALVELATLRVEKQDFSEAILLKREAAETATGEDARALYFEVAELAANALGDLHLAAQTYEDLRLDDPEDRAAWEPLLDVYERMNEHEKVAQLLGQVADVVDDPAERSRLRLRRVELGIDKLGLGDDAATQLKEILDEDPSQADAAILLGSILERNGREEELIELLSSQLYAALDRSDTPSVVSLSRRLGALLETRAPEQARDVYRRMLDVKGEDADALARLARLSGECGDPHERADALERLLAITAGEAAEGLALELGALFRAQEEPARARAAFERGFTAYPQSARLRAELEGCYREEGAWAELAAMYELEANALTSPERKVATLRLAAAVYRDELGQNGEGARVMRLARAAVPEDLNVLRELTFLLMASGELEAAADELGRALAELPEESPERASLLSERAVLSAQLGRDEEATDDWEDALLAGDRMVLEPLCAHLARVATKANNAGDTRAFRKSRLRLAELRHESGQTDEARAILTELLKADGRDRETIRALARLEEQLERWDAASASYRRLVALEEKDGIVDVALRLANACERAGRLSDARGGVERARVAEPQNQALRDVLERIYNETLALRELAELYLEDARAAMDVAGRFSHLIRAGSLLIQHGQDPQAAIEPLEEARSLRPNDLDCVALLADAYTADGRYAEASDVLTAAVSAHKGRRSRELSTLYHRLARVAQATDDRGAELQHLTTALDIDPQSGHVASELAYLAMELGEWDTATRALRAVTMLKTAAPLPRSLAYQHLGEIAQAQGDARRAVGFLKRALDEDPSLETARELLDQLS
ncbi:MAG TPA: tetratricopeptide repeat protein [Polyangiaceae bacterium]|nr:tetratricopeptide repeat protein [Polyangiaceae bacterium]